MKVLVDTKVLRSDRSTLEAWFPCEGDEGQNVTAGQAAIDYACAKLDCNASDLQWHTPDVFDVRYGSNYMATATYTATGHSVRFVSDLGDFREGDDQ